MELLERLKSLFATSKLFVDPAYPVARDEKRRKNSRKYPPPGPVKLGQGGTLDPAAFGILGT